MFVHENITALHHTGFAQVWIFHLYSKTTLSLSLSHTHTHTQSHSPAFSPGTRMRSQKHTCSLLYSNWIQAQTHTRTTRHCSLSTHTPLSLFAWLAHRNKHSNWKPEHTHFIKYNNAQMAVVSTMYIKLLLNPQQTFGKHQWGETAVNKKQNKSDATASVPHIIAFNWQDGQFFLQIELILQFSLLKIKRQLGVKNLISFFSKLNCHF